MGFGSGRLTKPSLITQVKLWVPVEGAGVDLAVSKNWRSQCKRIQKSPLITGTPQKTFIDEHPIKLLGLRHLRAEEGKGVAMLWDPGQGLGACYKQKWPLKPS